MGHPLLHEIPLAGREHVPLAIHHQVQLTLFHDEFLVRVGMKVLPSGPRFHAADFNENIALKLMCSFVDVCENERLAVEGIANPGAWRRKEFHDFLLIAVSSPDKAARFEVCSKASC
jgi:hypothetical protein